MNMICALCNLPIKDYNPRFHQLKINDTTKDLCQDCIDTFTKWQQKALANLFPSKTAKRWLQRNK